MKIDVNSIAHTPALSKAYKDIAERAKEQIVAFFDNELLDLDSAIEHTASVAAKDDATKQEIRSAIDYLLGVFDEICKTLDFQTELATTV